MEFAYPGCVGESVVFLRHGRGGRSKQIRRATCTTNGCAGEAIDGPVAGDRVWVGAAGDSVVVIWRQDDSLQYVAGPRSQISLPCTPTAHRAQGRPLPSCAVVARKQGHRTDSERLGHTRCDHRPGWERRCVEPEPERRVAPKDVDRGLTNRYSEVAWISRKTQEVAPGFLPRELQTPTWSRSDVVMDEMVWELFRRKP